MHFWSDHLTRVDQFFDFKISKGHYAAGGSNRSDAQREIETREAAAHVRIHWRRSAHGKEHVIVHPHQTGEHGVAFEIENLRARWDFRSCARRRRLDLPAADYNGLVLKRRGARAIDDAYMGKCDHRRICADKLLAVRRRSLGQATY